MSFNGKNEPEKNLKDISFNLLHRIMEESQTIVADGLSNWNC